MSTLKRRWPDAARLARPIALLAAVVLLAAPALAQNAKPKHKDSPAFVKPKEVTLTTAVEPTTARPGQTVTYKVTAKVDAPWHIYAFSTKQPAEGPRSTQFDFFDPADLQAGKTWKPDHAPVRKKEPAFPNLAAVEFHEKTVTWSVPVTIPKTAKPGKKSLRSQIYFQICNDKVCKPPVYLTLPAATVTVADAVGFRGLDRSAILGALLVAVEAGPTQADAAPAEQPAVEPEPAVSTTEGRPEAGTAAGSIEQGLIPFLLWSAAGGFFALLMPCVWPMVPVTVNFFVKQGQSKGGSPTRLAITYCLAIIAIFTLVGVLFSVFKGATSLSKLGNDPYLNAFVAVVLVGFGLSLLGLFEIRLPSFLLNASARNEGRGGLVGVIFMALTLTITSFTCTFPVVGGLMVMAAKGDYFYPIVGMVAFSTVLAFPFFLLALAPGLLAKLPRSGDWMNSVKVVGGLVEIGAAFKFINTAEIGFGTTPQSAWIDSQVIVAVWAVLALVCGLYLLGIFRTDHDHEDVRIGPGRILFGSLFLFLALYLTPALFGFPPKGPIYDRLIVGILPLDSDELSLGREIIAAIPPPVTNAPSGTTKQVLVQAEAPPKEVKATSSDPEEAIRQEKRVHGVAWGMSLEQAKEQAQAQNKPVLIDFTGVNCMNCRLMERSVMPRPEVTEKLREFVTVQLYTDFVPIDSITAAKREELAEKNLYFQQELTSSIEQPSYVAVTPEGEFLVKTGGAMEPSVFLAFLDQALAKYEKTTDHMAKAPITAMDN